MSDQQQLNRAVANTLWSFLRAGERGWHKYTEARALSHTGNPRVGNYASAHVTNVYDPGIEIISITYANNLTLWAEDWPGGESWRITRRKNHEDEAISRLPAAAIADYEAALEHATCRKPFTIETDEHGVKHLARNRHDGTITHLAAAALEAVARACELQLIPKHVEEALLTDSDINLDEILAARLRAGALEP